MESKTPLSIDDIKKMDKLALTRTEAASAMGLDARTVTKGIEDGTIPGVQIGRRVLIPRIPFLALWGITEDIKESVAVTSGEAQ